MQHFFAILDQKIVCLEVFSNPGNDNSIMNQPGGIWQGISTPFPTPLAVNLALLSISIVRPIHGLGAHVKEVLLAGI